MKRFNQSLFAVLAVQLFAIGPVSAETAVLPPEYQASAHSVASPAVLQAKTESLPPEAEAVLAKLYEVAPELKSLTLRNCQFVEDKLLGRAYWTLMFDNRKSDVAQEPPQPFATAHVTIDAKTYRVQGFSFYDPKWQPNQHLSADAAKAKAESVLAKLLGDEARQFRISHVGEPMSYPVDATSMKGQAIRGVLVQFDRYVNGIPLKYHGISMEFFGDRLTSFFLLNDGVWEGNPFPDPSQAMTKEQAEQKYRDLLEMELMYRLYSPDSLLRYLPGTKGQPETRPSLLYVPTFTGAVDAATGEPAKLWYTPTRVEPQTFQLDPQGKPLKAASREEAEKLLKERFGVDVSGLKFEAMKGAEGPPLTSYTWMKEANGQSDMRPLFGTTYVHMTVNAKTNIIQSLSVQVFSDKWEEPKLSRDEALKQALSFLETHLDSAVKEVQLRNVMLSTELQHQVPEWVDQAKLQQVKPVPFRPEYAFVFHATHQGVPVEERAYYVMVDARTGHVSGFQLAPAVETAALPDKSGAVSAAEAEDAFVNHLELELVYIWPEFMGQRAPEPLLVYMPREDRTGAYVDALTGKILEIRYSIMEHVEE